ncbi:MAG: DNA translocase FtsK, partial [Actinomycetota bacterium]|nr:DNA translocase FtsK [Actinomycetota bacterium]
MATKTRKTKAARKPKKRKAPAPRRRFGAGVWLRVPVLDQRELDLIGLALVAVGVFLACVMYLGWAGGEVGGALTDGVRHLVGTVGYAVPVGLVAAGAIVVMRPMLPSGRPFGTGAACLLAGATLAFAAGTLGLGPAGARTDVWERSFIEDRGGVVGQGLYT